MKRNLHFSNYFIRKLRFFSKLINLRSLLTPKTKKIRLIIS